jgi:hypothetical protein
MLRPVPRFFNTAGPNNPDDHYTLPVLARLPEVRALIDKKLYFVLHAPRQVGKTTSLLTLARELTAEGTYTAALLTMETGAPFSNDPGAAEAAILSAWLNYGLYQLPAELRPPPWPEAPPGSRIGAALSAWAQASPRPLVIFLDEIDALRDDTLLSVLRQIRSAYAGRPEHFPASLALIGLRDVRDYKVASGGREHLGTSSPFNIKAESITLRNFTSEEVAALYAQHTAETGQIFLPEATDRAFYLTRGQPWLVNALARQLTEVLVKDRGQSITLADVDRAKEILILRQDTHLDSLAERLREPRIKAILEPMLAGEMLGDVPDDDRRFAIDLGLVRRTEQGGLDVANPIYREVIARVLASGPRDSLPQIAPTWLKPDGRLDAARLLEAFLAFWRAHGEALLGSAPYHEIAPHLVLMAFLHRVINGGGSLDREYALGRGRMDLCLRYGPDTLAMEIKVWRPKAKDPLAEGLIQLDGYLAGLGLDTGWLVIFDRRPKRKKSGETRAESSPARTASGRQIIVVRA